MFRLTINFLNFLRVAKWRFILALRGGSIGRRVVIQPGVCLASGKGRPIILHDGVHLMRGVVLSTGHSGRIELQDNVYIGEYGVLTSNAAITIGPDSIIAPHADLVDFNHSTDDLARTVLDQPVAAAPIRIGRDVWLGARVAVLRGVTIGDQAVVGAGAVVTSDLPARAVAVGVPARVIRQRGPS
jgi:acetyltransferase-like isoleucine patch superfamily enzyme